MSRRLIPALMMLPAFAPGQQKPPQEPAAPVELGQVQWSSDLEAALARSRAGGRPVLLLFQEIPGCETCRDFGKGPLSHPLLVEAIETEFLPLAVRNNRPGPEAGILQRFGETAWNNPVVRFLDADGKDLVPRREGVWTTAGIAGRMVSALRAAGRPAPGYLQLLAAEKPAAVKGKAVFAMHCYWEGEAALGGLEGVLSTRPGLLQDREVVEVVFDPARLPFAELVKKASELDCADAVFASSEKEESAARIGGAKKIVRTDAAPREVKAGDHHYYLGQSPLKFLPLTRLQVLRVNRELGTEGDPGVWLSPRQEKLAAALRKAWDLRPVLFQEWQPAGTVFELPAVEQKLRAALTESRP
ncbi:MAG: VPGUxxT family thioredoxin-like (seleno)protein, type 2 [Planctomycetota bacterium]